MNFAHSTPPRLEFSQPGTATLLQAVIDPVVVIGVLLASVLWFDGRFDAPYLILSLIVFPMTFPGGFARGAFSRFGRGRHRAALNYGDCFSYALAISTGEPLLFKGDDFVHTDVTVVDPGSR